MAKRSGKTRTENLNLNYSNIAQTLALVFHVRLFKQLIWNEPHCLHTVCTGPALRYFCEVHCCNNGTHGVEVRLIAR